jgi:GNAT superfamily N-acetyltransferase
MDWIREVATIHRNCSIMELDQIGLKLDIKHSVEWFMWMWSNQDCEILTHRIDRKIVGFVTNVDGEVMLYVDPEHQRKGIGSSLIPKEGAMWVLDGNEIAEKFYEKNGFFKTDESRETEMFEHKVTENLWKWAGLA